MGVREPRDVSVGLDHGIERRRHIWIACRRVPQRHRHEYCPLTIDALPQPASPVPNDYTGKRTQGPASRVEPFEARDQIDQQLLAQILLLMAWQAQPANETTSRHRGFAEQNTNIHRRDRTCRYDGILL